MEGTSVLAGSGQGPLSRKVEIPRRASAQKVGTIPSRRPEPSATEGADTDVSSCEGQR